MNYKIIIIFSIFLCSCSNNIYNSSHKSSFSSSGFSYIYNEDDHLKKIVNKRFDNNEFQISHNRLKTGTLVKLTNPENNISLNLKIKKRSKYPEFYEILITEAVASKLKLNPEIPFVEIQELKKNKSFVAKKAKTFNEEKAIHQKAPITNVKIDNISKSDIVKKLKIKKFSIIIAEFYSQETANLLKKNLISENNFLDKNKLIVKKIKKNTFQLISGPYNTINLLKNDYIELKRYGFEELEIKINE